MASMNRDSSSPTVSRSLGFGAFERQSTCTAIAGAAIAGKFCRAGAAHGLSSRASTPVTDQAPPTGFEEWTGPTVIAIGGQRNTVAAKLQVKGVREIDALAEMTVDALTGDSAPAFGSISHALEARELWSRQIDAIETT